MAQTQINYLDLTLTSLKKAMNPSAQIAEHVRNVYFGGNWTGVNLKDVLDGVGWQQATAKVGSLNTIAALVYHINYYVAGVLKVLQGGPLDIRDKFSFDLSPIQSQKDWEDMLNKFRSDAESLILLIEKLPPEKLNDVFVDEKYGTCYRNLHGLIEHTHYHLGQIVLIKKLLTAEGPY